MIHHSMSQSHRQQIPRLLVVTMTSSDVPTFDTSSTAFSNMETIPDRHAAEHDNLSPAVQWEAGPEETQAYALIVEDPDAPQEIPFVHWLVYNIPSTARSLYQALPTTPVLQEPKGAMQGTNDKGTTGYFGPRPPVGDDAHHYHFQLFALDEELPLQSGANRAELEESMRGHVIGAGSFVGTYHR
jgi:Raf kinase inhibitor-like YbhB/YbcL family protein